MHQELLCLPVTFGAACERMLRCVGVCVCVCVRVRAHLSRIYLSGADLNTGVVVDLATVVAVVGGRCRGRGFY